jgi:hypothetical protein
MAYNLMINLKISYSLIVPNFFFAKIVALQHEKQRKTLHGHDWLPSKGKVHRAARHLFWNWHFLERINSANDCFLARSQRKISY